MTLLDALILVDLRLLVSFPLLLCAVYSSRMYDFFFASNYDDRLQNKNTMMDATNCDETKTITREIDTNQHEISIRPAVSGLPVMAKKERSPSSAGDRRSISPQKESAKYNEGSVLSDRRDRLCDIPKSDNWRCVCETGFLPPGLLKSFGGMEAMVRMSTGQCYHKTT